MLERLFQVIDDQTEVDVTNRVWRRRQLVFASREKLDALSPGKLQKDELWPVTLCFRVVDLFRTERIGVPAHAAFGIGDFKRNMAKTKT